MVVSASAARMAPTAGRRDDTQVGQGPTSQEPPVSRATAVAWAPTDVTLISTKPWLSWTKWGCMASCATEHDSLYLKCLYIGCW